MNILVLYAFGQSPMRASLRDNLYSFRRYCDARVFYANLVNKQFPGYLVNCTFDLIIFHTLFASNHWAGEKKFKELLSKASVVNRFQCPKVLLPQDEFINSDLLSMMIDYFGISKVFTVCPLDIVPTVYASVKRRDVEYERILTGYIEPKMVRRVNYLLGKYTSRPIDIGYRASGRPQAWWGRLGYMKQVLADAVNISPAASGLTLDISTAGHDVIIGDAWLKYLLSCRYTIGSESGTSIIDNDGEIQRKTTAYLRDNPSATFTEIEKNCFPGLDGKTILNAISPRHFEACITRTCQLLVEGDYGGILKPDIHYISIKKDLSNLDEVIRGLGDEARRREIADRAYRDIVESNLYTYEKMVDAVVNGSLGRVIVRRDRLDYLLLLLLNRFLESLEDLLVWRPRTVAYSMLRNIKRLLN